MEYLIELGVSKFKKDYPNCTKQNILTDHILGQFFKASLLLTKQNLPRAKQVITDANIKVMTYYTNGITLLVAKIDKNLNLSQDDQRS